LQNKKHVEDLKKVYHFDDIPFFSMIVFFGDCEFKNLIDLPSRPFLTKSDKVINIFNEILESNQIAKYDNKLEIANLLKQAVNNGESSIIIEKHTDNIQKLKARNSL
jgi:hypothetical protein